jgi:hypothetical protein
MKRTCVLRDVRGVQQYIPVEDAVNVTAGEKLFHGDFNSGTVKDGPSGSHQRTVCDPVGPLTEVIVGGASATTLRPVDHTLTECVLREVAPGDTQYVPTSEVPSLVEGERLFVGVFTSRQENLGPSGSHRRTICLPNGPVSETVVVKQAA